mgnify:CR=1 FL=1
MTEQRIAYPEDMDDAAYDKHLDGLSQEAIDVVMDTSYPEMVSRLAKPGEDIRDQMTFDNFTLLAAACASVVTAGDRLDLVKKRVVYNKDIDIGQAPICKLPLQLMPAFSSLTAEKAHLLHMAAGLAGEASEMLSAIFDHVFNGAPLDVDNVVEEGGDSLFYIQGLIGPVRVGLSEIALANMAKLLGKRYPNGYSDQAAQLRADKASA